MDVQLDQLRFLSSSSYQINAFTFLTCFTVTLKILFGCRLLQHVESKICLSTWLWVTTVFSDGWKRTYLCQSNYSEGYFSLLLLSYMKLTLAIREPFRWQTVSGWCCSLKKMHWCFHSENGSVSVSNKTKHVRIRAGKMTLINALGNN